MKKLKAAILAAVLVTALADVHSAVAIDTKGDADFAGQAYVDLLNTLDEATRLSGENPTERMRAALAKAVLFSGITEDDRKVLQGIINGCARNCD